MSSERIVGLFVEEAWRRYDEDRYAEALWAAEKAREVARGLGLLGLEIRATDAEAAALRMLGDPARALARATWVLSVAENPAARERVASAEVTRHIANAYLTWVECARCLPEIATDRLLGVLDAGERWLRAAGRASWRAGLCAQRARVLAALGRANEAVGFAEEAVALARAAPDAPGYTLATYRWTLADLLRRVGRAADAIAQYQAVLADPRGDGYDRNVALQGLARCALAARETNAAERAGHDAGSDAARRHAEQAVAEAEAMGDDALCPALDALVAALLASGDARAAVGAARRYRDAASRVGGVYQPYLAMRASVDAALAAGDAAAAEALIAAWEPLVRALDRTRGGADCARELSERRTQLAGSGAR